MFPGEKSEAQDINGSVMHKDYIRFDEGQRNNRRRFSRCPALSFVQAFNSR